MFKPMSRCGLRPRQRRGLTLIELMIVVALLAVITVLAGPPMAEFLGMQRLRGIASQLATDLQYARSEATSRNQFVAVMWRNEAGDDNSCYTAFASATQPALETAINPSLCNCNQPVGSACTGDMREIRSVQVARSSSIQLRLNDAQPHALLFDPASGYATHRRLNTFEAADVADFCVEVTRNPRGRLRVVLNKAGRSQTCSPDSSVPGVPVCTQTEATCLVP